MNRVLREEVLRCRVTWGEHVDDHLCVVAHAHTSWRWLRVADVVLVPRAGIAERVLAELPGCTVVVEPGEGGNILRYSSGTVTVAGDALPLGSLAHAFLAWGMDPLPGVLTGAPLLSAGREGVRPDAVVSHRHGGRPARLVWKALGRAVPGPR